MIALLETPRPARARADPSRIGGVVDELLRWWTPVMTFRRTATTDVDVAGQRIAAGTRWSCPSSANRDEACSPNPSVSTWSATPRRTSPSGMVRTSASRPSRARADDRAVHRGAHAHVLDRGGRRPGFLRSNFQRGVKRLPIRWTALRACRPRSPRRDHRPVPVTAAGGRAGTEGGDMHRTVYGLSAGRRRAPGRGRTEPAASAPAAVAAAAPGRRAGPLLRAHALGRRGSL